MCCLLMSMGWRMEAKTFGGLWEIWSRACCGVIDVGTVEKGEMQRKEKKNWWQNGKERVIA